MAASVRIEDEAFSDARIELLGTLAGYNRYEALGRMAHLWRLCTQRQLYVLSELLVTSCLGPNGAEHIIAAELGERVEGPPPGIRIKGTATRIEWLSSLSSTRQQAGKARASNAARDERGRLLPANHQQPSSSPPARDQQATSIAPPKSSAPAPAPAPAQEKKKTKAEPSAHLDLKLQEPGPETPTPKADWQQVIDLHWKLFEQRLGTKPTWNASYPKLAKQLLKSHKLDEVLRRLRLFHAKPAGQFPDGYDFKTFVAHVDRFVVAPANVVPLRPPAPPRDEYTDIDIEALREY